MVHLKNLKSKREVMVNSIENDLRAGKVTLNSRAGRRKSVGSL